MTRLLVFTFVLILSVAPKISWAADDVYQSPETFITESFGGKTPKARTLTPDSALTTKVKKIMGDHYRLPSVKYWTDGQRTAWILEDIGKYKPITTGYLVNTDNELERVKVLVYRESHGWEVKEKFFTRQFKGAGLKREKKLDKRIDGIAGATLSVHALKTMGALALTLHKAVTEGGS